MKIVTVLLARIRSKRIPEKNLVSLGGVPLIEWTLQIMKQLPYPAYVFTDSNKIKDISENYNCIVRDKVLENNQGIHYTSQELKCYNKEMQADVIVLFQATSPFRDLEKVKEWISNFPLYSVKCALTVRPVKLNLYTESGDRVWPVTGRDYQGGNILYKETGSVYIFHKGQIEKNHITDGKRKLLIDPYDFDIDSYEELERAELFLKKEKTKYDNNIIDNKQEVSK